MLGFKKRVWVNIDKPTKTFTIHHQCIYSEKKTETHLKGTNEMKTDGGWFSYKNENQAILAYQKDYQNFNLKIHC